MTDNGCKGNTMPGIYKVTEVVGTSPVSFAEAANTIRHMKWFEVVEQRGSIAELQGIGIPGDG
jgi:flavin-binding protein dodecin